MHNITKNYHYFIVIDCNICIAKNDFYCNNAILIHFINFYFFFFQKSLKILQSLKQTVVC